MRRIEKRFEKTISDLMATIHRIQVILKLYFHKLYIVNLNI